MNAPVISKKSTLGQLSAVSGLMAIILSQIAYNIIGAIFRRDLWDNDDTYMRAMNLAFALSIAAHVICFFVGLLSLTRSEEKRLWAWSGTMLNGLALTAYGTFLVIINRMSITF